VAEAVVGPAALGVGEDLVRLGDGPEPKLGVRRLADIRVELAGRNARLMSEWLASLGTPSSS